jgi:hypothetical protein
MVLSYDPYHIDELGDLELELDLDCVSHVHDRPYQLTNREVAIIIISDVHDRPYQPADKQGGCNYYKE